MRGALSLVRKLSMLAILVLGTLLMVPRPAYAWGCRDIPGPRCGLGCGGTYGGCCDWCAALCLQSSGWCWVEWSGCCWYPS
jgi:hypothetical protein